MYQVRKKKNEAPLPARLLLREGTMEEGMPNKREQWESPMKWSMTYWMQENIWRKKENYEDERYQGENDDKQEEQDYPGETCVIQWEVGGDRGGEWRAEEGKEVVDERMVAMEDRFKAMEQDHKIMFMKISHKYIEIVDKTHHTYVNYIPIFFMIL